MHGYLPLYLSKDTGEEWVSIQNSNLHNHNASHKVGQKQLQSYTLILGSEL